MSNYYDEILDKILELIKDERLDEAQALVLAELNMPYIPIEFEKKLKEAKVIIKEQRNDTKTTELEIEQIESYLYGNDEQQLIAVNQLNKMNLRAHLDLCKEYLLSKPSHAAAALLIDSCIEQAIDEEFVFTKDDVEYSFNPRDLERPFDSGGFHVAVEYLSNWFESSDPSFFELCSQQLIHDTFNFLPLSYDEDEGYDLALHVAKVVFGLMNRGNEWNEFLKSAKRNELQVEKTRLS
ncbi:DUF3196 domain-containing protein [Anaerorhabdus sp.]|nr:DUF3196 domain-containing protein [Anaerorhabdus sp.]MEA4874965.1 DUF3196 domain-containing protein [Anaerorhabdus sp.]